MKDESRLHLAFIHPSSFSLHPCIFGSTVRIDPPIAMGYKPRSESIRGSRGAQTGSLATVPRKRRPKVNKSTATLAVCVLVGSVALQALAQNTPPTKPAIQQATAAQPTATAAPSVVPTRVAVLNTNRVLKQFNKAQQLNSYIQGIVTSFGQQITAKREEATKPRSCKPTCRRRSIRPPANKSSGA
jgi:hypothetical protein